MSFDSESAAESYRLAYYQLKAGYFTYRSNLLVIAVVRVGVILAIWLAIQLLVRPVTALLLVVVAGLVLVAYLELLSVFSRLRKARLAVEEASRQLSSFGHG